MVLLGCHIVRIVDKCLKLLIFQRLGVLLFGKHLFGNESLNKVFGRFSLAFSPFVEGWLEEAFVVLCHTSKGRPPVEEIELFVIFLSFIFNLIFVTFIIKFR